MDLTDNPLLQTGPAVHYQAINPEHITPALEHLLQQCRTCVEHISSSACGYGWDEVAAPLSLCTEALSRAWGVVNHLQTVVNTPELRAAFNENQPKVTSFYSDLGQNLALYGKYKALAASSEFASLSPARQRIVERQLRDFRLGGAELDDAHKPRFAAIQEEMAALSTRFSENVLDATNDFTHHESSEEAVTGLPPDALLAARSAAQAKGLNGYLFSLHQPSLIPVLQYCANRNLRELMYRANCTRASDQAQVFSNNAGWDNTANILQLLRLRHEEAQMLGYASYAELSLAPKMAQSPQQVIDFLLDMARRARPYAERDFAQLRAFAAAELGISDLQAWDLAYASEKMREKNYAFSAQEVKQYFPLDKVLQGLFGALRELFDVQIEAASAPVWHPDVQFFRITRGQQLLGEFWLDLYARAHKRAGAWMDNPRSRRRLHDGVQTPQAYLVCNFTPPLEENGVRQMVYLNHSEMITLFHEFGHGIHHLLTQVDELELAGINGVEWDAVELPSQMMENFCWRWEVLQEMSEHQHSKAQLPRALYDKMLAAKNFQSGLATLRQVEFALIDMRLHHGFEPHDGAALQNLIDRVRQEVAVLIPPAWNRFCHAFAHIFAGGYAAGYYSYKWAEVLSADAFAAFEEECGEGGNVLQTKAGLRFLQEVLAVGSSRDALDSFIAFRGRAPSIEALLRHGGMSSPL
ncbi:M3 family metallopeptidase [Massilia sp. W12]|uniref:M3 family metallopeptidase n=1 Tax=Massilia sp. W12 TaxID=3126507 RepID=UPI0030D43B56